MHDRLAVAAPRGVAHRPDAAVAGALGGHDRVPEAHDLQAAGLQLAAHRVDQERQVLGVGLDHRAGGLVAVLLLRRVEGAHGDRIAVARAGELEQRQHLGEQVLGGDPVRAAGAQPAQIGAGEAAHHLRPILRDLLVDELEQPLLGLLEPRALLLREAHMRIMPASTRGSEAGADLLGQVLAELVQVLADLLELGARRSSRRAAAPRRASSEMSSPSVSARPRRARGRSASRAVSPSPSQRRKIQLEHPRVVAEARATGTRRRRPCGTS